MKEKRLLSWKEIREGEKIREWEKAWLVAGELDCDSLKNKHGVIYIRQDVVSAHHAALRAKELEEIRERVRFMKREKDYPADTHTNFYNQAIDDVEAILDELIEKKI
jgi:hypothetical protein